MDECKPLKRGATVMRLQDESGARIDVRPDTEECVISGRGSHSFPLEVNLTIFGTHSLVKLGYVGHKDSSS